MASSIGEAFAAGFGEALGQALGTAFFILLLVTAAMMVAAAVLFFIGLQKRPRTTVLAYVLAIAFAIIGQSIELEWLFLLGAGIGLAAGIYLLDDPPIHLLQSRAYTLFLTVSSGGAILASLGLTARLLPVLAPHLPDLLLPTLLLTGIALIPGIIGAAYLLKLR